MYDKTDKQGYNFKDSQGLYNRIQAAEYLRLLLAQYGTHKVSNSNSNFEFHLNYVHTITCL